MLMPKKTKHRKEMKGRRRGIANRGYKLCFGTIGLQSLDPASVTSRQIEAARKCLARVVRRNGKLFIRIFPARPKTQKPAETRMGGGKGNPEFWVAKVRAGTIIFELSGVNLEEAKKVLRSAGHKLPIHTKIIQKEEGSIFL